MHGSPPPGWTRRRFLGGAVTLVCAAPALPWACGDEAVPEGAGEDGGGEPARGTSVDGWWVPGGAKLSPARYAQVAALFDALVPGDEALAGATRAQAAWYLDRLLSAFDVDPPRIYAGGPFSGRHGGLDGFSEFQRLTRVEELRWRTYVEGSRGIREREFNGPVPSLLARYEAGLDALDGEARRGHGNPFTLLSLEERQALLLAADGAFVQLAYEHAAEGTYGDPVYGGNAGRAGWTAIGYEGDRQPLGYTARQMARPEEG